MLTYLLSVFLSFTLNFYLPMHGDPPDPQTEGKGSIVIGDDLQVDQDPPKGL